MGWSELAVENGGGSRCAMLFGRVGYTSESARSD